jgi:hypothetical protein
MSADGSAAPGVGRTAARDALAAVLAGAARVRAAIGRTAAAGDDDGDEDDEGENEEALHGPAHRAKTAPAMCGLSRHARGFFHLK